MSTSRVVIVGAGLAGISAAVRLAERGRAVTVLESRTRLGGRASSFRRGSLTVDNGQHVILRCYQAYLGLLTALGVADHIPVQERLDIPVAGGDGRIFHLRRGRTGPAPAHLLSAVLGYAVLTPRERISVLRAAARLRHIDPSDPAVDDRTFGDWLDEQRQSQRARALLWDLITLPTLNLDSDRASLALAATVFRSGVLDAVTAADIGIPQVPLASLHDAPVRRLFGRLGIELHTGVRVRHVAPEGAAFTVHATTRQVGPDEQLAAGSVVLAVPHQAAARLLPPGVEPPGYPWRALGTSAIVNAHLLLDRRVMEQPFLAVPRSPVQWVFDRSAGAPARDRQYLTTSVSSADEIVDLPAAEILTTQLDALREALPLLRTATIIDAFVTREPRATFCQQSGTARLRPTARTSSPGLVLAGSWTATGLPDTMEGAVRSGINAADVVLGLAATADECSRSSRRGQVRV